jgi:hypothetical protein
MVTQGNTGYQILMLWLYMVLDIIKYQDISEKTIDDIKMVDSKSEVTNLYDIATQNCIRILD